MALVSLLVALATEPSASATPAHIRNMDLEEQVAGHEPMLPQGERYTLTSRMWLFYKQALEGYVLDGYDHPGLYHGGYWVDAYAEVRPVEQLTLNTRLVLLNPAASYGIVNMSRIVPFVHARLEESPNPDAPHPFSARIDLFDLDRQTLGAGLTLQSKEMSGFLGSAAQSTSLGAVRLRYLFAGTGGYRVDGDLHAYQLDWRDDALGLLTFHTGHVESDGVFGTDWFQSVYSRQSFGPVGYRAELSTRAGAYAGLIGVEVEGAAPWIEARAGGQLRRYGDGYFEGYAGRVQHDYLSVEQLDIPAATSANFLVSHATGDVVSGEGDLRLRTIGGLWLVSSNEVVWFGAETAESTTWYYRHGLELCSRAELCISAVVGNKVSAARALPEEQDFRNVQMFLAVPHIGFDVWMRF